MSNLPRVVWPMLGQSALEVMAIIDWALEELAIEPPCYIGGISLGGDIAVAAAGLDVRIGCVAAILATPDWNRPGMRVDGEPVPQGRSDPYAAGSHEPRPSRSSAGRRTSMCRPTGRCGLRPPSSRSTAPAPLGFASTSIPVPDTRRRQRCGRTV